MNLADITLYNAIADDKSPNTDTNHVAAVNARIGSVSVKVERLLDRKVKEDSYTEKFSVERGAGTKSVRLRGYPVTSIDSVKVYDVAKVEGDDFSVDETTGVVSFFEPVTREFNNWQNAIVIEYTGGMATTTSAFKEAYPDIAIEVCVQAAFELARQKNLANKSTATGAGIVTSHNPYGLQPGLLEAIEPYRFPKQAH